jgi:UDP-N-acetylmuramoyl-tripeptide--D-alanyl-D-alanine ligase
MMTLAESARALDATVVGADARFASVSTDSRMIESGALFVALRGDRFDGHDYTPAARDSGAAAAMVEHPVAEAGALPLLIVRDTRLALGALAHHWRRKFSVPVIGIVGSNGKTTVKEMIAAILRTHFGEPLVLATVGNLNNDIGLPITVLRMRADHACAVIELGMNHPGETAYLADVAQPTVAVINNAQREHQEFMQSVDEVAAEHAALIRSLPNDGIAVLNRDDPHYPYWVGIAGPRAVYDFGASPAAAVHGTYRLTAAGSEIEIETPAGRASVALQVPGAHNVQNALAAVAAALAVDVDLGAIARGLESFRAVKGRMQLKRGRDGAQLIDDTYNANPDSVRAAIDVLAAATPPRVLILGDMGEVGAHGEAFHEEVGGYAKRQGVERMLAVGALVRSAIVAFGSDGEHFDSVDALIARARSLTPHKGTMLVKGSRFMRMERVVEHLLEGEAASCS